jgi:hypothetical protein
MGEWRRCDDGAREEIPEGVLWFFPLSRTSLVVKDKSAPERYEPGGFDGPTVAGAGKDDEQPGRRGGGAERLSLSHSPWLAIVLVVVVVVVHSSSW